MSEHPFSLFRALKTLNSGDWTNANLNPLHITSLTEVAFGVRFCALVALSVICIVIARVFPEYQTYALIGFIGNFAGAVGDIWITSKLWKYLPYKDALVYDSKSGCDVHSNNPSAAAKGVKAAKKAKGSGAFGKNWAISSLVIMMVQLFSPSLLPLLGFNRSLTLGFGEFYFFKTEVAANGNPQAITFNLLAPLVIGLVLALVIKAIAIPKQNDEILSNTWTN